MSARQTVLEKPTTAKASVMSRRHSLSLSSSDGDDSVGLLNPTEADEIRPTHHRAPWSYSTAPQQTAAQLSPRSGHSPGFVPSIGAHNSNTDSDCYVMHYPTYEEEEYPRDGRRDDSIRPAVHFDKEPPKEDKNTFGPRPGTASEDDRRVPPLPNVGDAVIWNPSFQRDLTIHLELDIEDDLASKIADLEHLKRLGRFQDADTYFENNLVTHFHDGSVILSYADLLLEKGDYGRIFESLADGDNIGRLATALRSSKLWRNRGEEINISLILQLARSCSDPNLEHADNFARDGFAFLQYKSRQHNAGATELQILCRSLRLFSYIFSNSNYVTEADFYTARNWQRWVGHYRNLLQEGRHWELHDVVVAFSAAFGPVQTCISLFETDSLASGITKLVHDWELVTTDETSSICLLDILVALCSGLTQMLPKSSSFVDLAAFAFNQARLVAASIREANPESIKCRTYFRWILAEAKYSRFLGGLQNTTAQTAGMTPPFFKFSPGLDIWQRVLPIYVPVASENPGWPVFDSGSSAASIQTDELLKVVLSSAKELGDFATQAECLQEMICRAQDPLALFADLDRLQMSIMGDKLGALQTRLSKYLLAGNDHSRRELHQELVLMDPRLPLWNGFRHPVVEWCHRRVQYALLLSIHGDSKEAKATDRQATDLYGLPRASMGKQSLQDQTFPAVPPPFYSPPKIDPVRMPDPEGHEGQRRRRRLSETVGFSAVRGQTALYSGPASNPSPKQERVKKMIESGIEMQDGQRKNGKEEEAAAQTEADIGNSVLRTVLAAKAARLAMQTTAEDAVEDEEGGLLRY